MGMQERRVGAWDEAVEAAHNEADRHAVSPATAEAMLAAGLAVLVNHEETIERAQQIIDRAVIRGDFLDARAVLASLTAEPFGDSQETPAG